MVGVVENPHFLLVDGCHTIDFQSLVGCSSFFDVIVIDFEKIDIRSSKYVFHDEMNNR